MKIISIDARMINNSGIGVYLRNMVISLAGSYNLILLGDPAELKKSFPGLNYKVIECFTPIYSIKEQLELALKIPKCDLFITPHYNIPLVPVKARKRMAIMHDMYHLAFYNSLSLQAKIYAKLMIKMALKKSGVVITISQFSKDEIIKYTSAKKDKIKIIHFGIDKEKIINELSITPAKIVKEKLNLPDKYILFVGNVKPNKNLAGLLKAFEKNLSRGASYKLVVAGKKEGFITGDNEVFSIIESSPLLKENVIFTGFVENNELWKIYEAASMLVFPSYYEGFGIPPLEAMVCGCPVIASNAASIPEVCGEAALYINPSSPEDIAAKIEMLMDNPDLRNELVTKGKQRLNEFSLKKFSDNFHTVIEDLINE